MLEKDEYTLYTEAKVSAVSTEKTMQGFPVVYGTLESVEKTAPRTSAALAGSDW